MGRLQGKVVLITGAARGLGEAQALMCASEGARIAIADVLYVEGEALAERIRENGGTARYIHLDVTKQDDWRSGTAMVHSLLGPISVLVNNAGVLELNDVCDLTSDQVIKSLNVNSVGALLGCQHCIPQMKEIGSGSIVNISSTSGMVGSTGGYTAYAMSKGAIRMMSRNIAIECAPYNIRSNAIFPGPIRTPMTVSLSDPLIWEERVRSLPIKRIGEPKEVAYAVIYLASDEAAYVTGAELAVDGGTTAAL